MNTMKLAKAALGIVIVVVLFVIVMNWWGDYRSATVTMESGKGSSSTSSTATNGGTSGNSGTTQPAAGGAGTSTGLLVVTVDGLNFRAQPDGQSKAIRGLSKGERVTLLATEGDWYKIEDSKGVVGYITSNPTYTDEVD